MTPEQHRAAQKRHHRIHVRNRRAAYSLSMPPPPLAMTAPAGISVQNLDGFDRGLLHPEFGIEPRQVISIYRSAECGWSSHQADLFTGIVERDGHLQATILNRINAVAGKAWQVLPGGADPESVLAADLLNVQLHATNFQEMISHWLSARYMGWAAAEIIWEKIGDVTLPVHFIDVPARRFSFNSKDQPELLNDQITSLTGGEALVPGKWIFVRNRSPFGGLTVQSGLLRGATWMSIFKHWSWRDWVIYAEKFGIPLVIGTYRQGAQDDEKNALEAAVEDLGEAGSAIMSDQTNIEIREAQRGGDSAGLHRSIVREANEEISKLINGSTLTMATGGNGSFAQAEVHAMTSFAHVEADARMIAGNVAIQLFRAFLRFNGFTRAKVMRLVIHITRETDGMVRAQESKILQELGLKLDEEQIYEEHGFRKPPTDDRVLTGTQSEASSSPDVALETEQGTS